MPRYVSNNPPIPPNTCFSYAEYSIVKHWLILKIGCNWVAASNVCLRRRGLSETMFSFEGLKLIHNHFLDLALSNMSICLFIVTIEIVTKVSGFCYWVGREKWMLDEPSGLICQFLLFVDGFANSSPVAFLPTSGNPASFVRWAVWLCSSFTLYTYCSVWHNTEEAHQERLTRAVDGKWQEEKLA